MIKKRFCKLTYLNNKGSYKSWVEDFKDEIIVFKSKNKIYVKSSVCPHFGGPISFDDRNDNLFCYWHGLKFSLDGKCINQKTFKACLTTYDYEIKNNYIYVLKQ